MKQTSNLILQLNQDIIYCEKRIKELSKPNPKSPAIFSIIDEKERLKGIEIIKDQILLKQLLIEELLTLLSVYNEKNT